MTIRALALALGTALLAALVVAGCGGQSSRGADAAHLARSDRPFCHVFHGEAEPLVVEWPATDRAKLEALAKSGTVVVRYSGCRLEVLSACRAKSTAPTPYQWTALTVKHEKQSIGSRDELYARLPFGAAGLEGALSRKGALEADMTVVGRFEAPRPIVREDELEGDCAGATHSVRGMIVGAFRFFAGQSEGARAGASAFGGAVGGASTSTQELLSYDGEEQQCSAASTALGPPSGCGAVMRLELAALAEGLACPPKLTWDGQRCAPTMNCPAGTIANWGSCAAMGIAFPTGPSCKDRGTCDAECDKQSAEACFLASGAAAKRNDKRRQQQLLERSCVLGSAAGCWAAGEFLTFDDSFVKDPQRAKELLERACSGGAGHGCYKLAALLFTAAGVAKNVDRARDASKRGCELGDASSCFLLATRLHDLQQRAAATDAYERACNSGFIRACTARGELEEQSGNSGVSFFQRACDGGDARGCGLWSKAIFEGRGTARDPERAYDLARRSCTASDEIGCYVEGIASANGIGTAVRVDRARAALRRACDARFADACERLGRLQSQ